MFKKGDAPHINNFELGQHGRYRTNVWNYPGVNTFKGKGYELLALHPTVKPVGLIADAIRDCSHRRGLVLDPFLGSGTLLIAAERTGEGPGDRARSAIRRRRGAALAASHGGFCCSGRHGTDLGSAPSGAHGARSRARRGRTMTYEIGYRRPPPSGRFKTGTSGNPRGRPKGSSNFVTLIEHELAESVVVTENGKKKKVSRMQAIVMRMVAGALQGDQKALLTLVEILRRTGKFEQVNPADLLPHNYEAILESYVESRRRASVKVSGRTRSTGDES